MPCICICGRPMDCGETDCGICGQVAPETTAKPGLPPGMKEEDYTP